MPDRETDAAKDLAKLLTSSAVIKERSEEDAGKRAGEEEHGKESRREMYSLRMRKGQIVES